MGIGLAPIGSMVLNWRTHLLALFLLLGRCTGTPDFAFADDPMNQPLDSVGVKGYDTTLCSDKWNDCSDYDRQQFDTRYPGTSLESISRYPLSKGRPANQVHRDSEFSETEETEQGSDGETDYE